MAKKFLNNNIFLFFKHKFLEITLNTDYFIKVVNDNEQWFGVTEYGELYGLEYVTEATQYCVTAGSTLIFKSVQSRELGQYGLE